MEFYEPCLYSAQSTKPYILYTVCTKPCVLLGSQWQTRLMRPLLSESLHPVCMYVLGEPNNKQTKDYTDRQAKYRLVLSKLPAASVIYAFVPQNEVHRMMSKRDTLGCSENGDEHLPPQDRSGYFKVFQWWSRLTLVGPRAPTALPLQLASRLVRDIYSTYSVPGTALCAKATWVRHGPCPG